MKLFLLLNELSHTPLASDVHEARIRMERFVKLLRRVRGSLQRVELILRSTARLHDIELSAGYPVAKWQNDVEVDEKLRKLLLSISTRAEIFPKADELPEDVDLQDRPDCFHGGRPALALSAALLLGGLPLSLASDPSWDTAWLRAVKTHLVKNDDVVQTTRDIPHASAEQHVSEHEGWFAEKERIAIRDGHELWDRRAELFPSIEFCRDVRRDLGGFRSGDPALRQIIKRLSQLQAFFGAWDGAPIDPDRIPTKCTSESDPTLEEYKEQHTFTREDGTRQIFRWHVRFTPEPGRIFFDGDAEKRRGVIGCVARNGLPTVKSPT